MRKVMMVVLMLAVLCCGCGRTGPCRLANGFNVYGQGDAHFDEGGSPGSATAICYVQYTQDDSPIEGRSITLDLGQNKSSYKNDDWWYPDGAAIDMEWGIGQRSKWKSSGKTGTGGLVKFSGTRSFGDKNGNPYVSKISFSNAVVSSSSGELIVSSANAKDCRTQWPYELIPWNMNSAAYCDYHNGEHWFEGGYHYSGTAQYPPLPGDAAAASAPSVPFNAPILDMYPFNPDSYEPNFVNPEIFYYEGAAYFCVDPNGVMIKQTLAPLPSSLMLVDTTEPCPNVLENDDWLNNNYPDPPLFGYEIVSTTMVWQDGDMGASVVSAVPEVWAAGNDLDPYSVLLNSYPNRWDIAIATASPKEISAWSSMIKVWTESFPEGIILPITDIESSPDGKFHVGHSGLFITMEASIYNENDGELFLRDQMVYDDWSYTDDPNEVMVNEPNFIEEAMYNPERILFLPVVPVDVNDVVEMELIEATTLDKIRLLSSEWCGTGQLTGDLNDDGVVNMEDYAILFKE